MVTAPASAPVGERHVEGDPTAIQFDRMFTSVAEARGKGEGGIGLTPSCILASAIAATVCDGLLGAGAMRLA